MEGVSNVRLSSKGAGRGLARRGAARRGGAGRGVRTAPAYKEGNQVEALVRCLHVRRTGRPRPTSRASGLHIVWPLSGPGDRDRLVTASDLGQTVLEPNA